MSDLESRGPSVGLSESQEPQLAWFCLRTQLKHEHIATANLRLLPEVMVFNPRIRYRRPTRRGPVWFTESLFPSYIFARFDWREHLRRVYHAAGVAALVHFGARWPTIPDATMAELRATVGQEEVQVVETQPEVGMQAYDRGTDILTAFFHRQVREFLHPDLMPQGRKIIESCIAGAGLDDYIGLLEGTPIASEE